MDLTDANLATIKERSPFAGDEAHYTFRSSVEISESQCELRGLIGVHHVPATPGENARDAATVLHYAFELGKDAAAEDKQDDDWQRCSDVVATVVGTHQVTASMWAEFSANQIVPATALPIPLGESGVSGFAEIRGVRLVQPDSNDRSVELYSVVLDKIRNGFGMSVTTSIESTGLDVEVLRRALDRLNDVAALAYKEVRKA